MDDEGRDEGSASDDKNKADDATPPQETSKRLKMSENSENTRENEGASSTSTGNSPRASLFNKTKTPTNRNYRRSSRSGESSTNDNESVDEDATAHNESRDETNESESVEMSSVDYNTSASGDDSTFNYNISQTTSPSISNHTVDDSNTDSENEDVPLVLQKPKPKHNWFMIPEIVNRQFGYSAKLQHADLFQNRCYGSLHNVQRLELMYKLEDHTGCVNSINFHPDGSLLASGSDDRYIIVWDWKIGKPLFKYHTKHRLNVFQSKFLYLSGELHIASCSRDGQVRIVRLSQEGGVRDNRKLGTHRASCNKLAVLRDQPQVILSAGEDAVVMSHDVRKSKSDNVVTVKSGERMVPLFSVHGHPLRTHEFCVGGKDDTVRVYDQRKTSETLITYFPFKRDEPKYFHGLQITCAMYNHNGSEILASYNDADIYLFNADSQPGTYAHKYGGHRSGATIKGVNFFGPKSEFIVSGSDCGNVFYWEKNTEAIVQCMLGDDNGVVNCLEPHPTLPFICTSGLDWDVKVWVPSCETDPSYETIEGTIKENLKARKGNFWAGDQNEAPVLWMLWQHLRSTNRMSNLDLPNFLDALSSSDDEEDDTNQNQEEEWEDVASDSDSSNSSSNENIQQCATS